MKKQPKTLHPRLLWERSTKGTSFASLSRLRFGKMAPLPKGGWLRSRLGDIVGAIHESPDRAHRSIPPPSNDGPPPFRQGRQEKASPCVGKLSPKVTDEGSRSALQQACRRSPHPPPCGGPPSPGRGRQSQTPVSYRCHPLSKEGLDTAPPSK